MTVQTPTKSGNIVDLMNKQVANFGLLFVKLHHYHWYVKGSEFFTLHLKFEELYNEINLHYDALAERILTLGGAPVSTMAQTLQLASLQEAAGNEKAEAMVKQLIQDFTIVSGEINEAIVAADNMNDQPTADLLISIRQSLEKHNWMLNAFVG